MAFTRPKASQINFDTTNITDSLIRINSAETGNNTNDLGIVFERGNHTNAAIIFDESAGAFRMISTTHDASSATSNINISAHHNLHVGGLETTGNVAIGGNLTVSGTTTTVDVNSVNITNSFTFEGATDDSFETTLTVVDPTADRTITLPDVTGYAAIFQSDPGTTLVTATVAELNYVDGVTSNIQTQIDNISIVEADISDFGTYLTASDITGKLNLSGGTMSGAIAMGTNKITGVGDPTSAQDAATKAYVDSQTSSAVTATSTDTLTNKTLTSPALTTPTVTTAITLNSQADLRFADANTSNWVAFQAPNTVGNNVTWTLPATDGTEDQVLSTNGSGSLAWADAGSGSSLSGSSFPNSTISAMPGSAGDYDLGKNAAQDTAESPFEAGDSDAFGVNLETVYSMMDPAGTTTTVDLGTLS